MHRKVNDCHDLKPNFYKATVLTVCYMWAISHNSPPSPIFSNDLFIHKVVFSTYERLWSVCFLWLIQFQRSFHVVIWGFLYTRIGTQISSKWSITWRANCWVTVLAWQFVLFCNALIASQFVKYHFILTIYTLHHIKKYIILMSIFLVIPNVIYQLSFILHTMV